VRADTVSELVSGAVRGQGGGHKGGVTPCPLSGCPQKEREKCPKHYALSATPDVREVLNATSL
jgi:hypothetical protein